MAVELTALDVMTDAPVIPVIVLNDVNDAVPMAQALVAGGIRMLEVTLRTPAALACIEAIDRVVMDIRDRLRRGQRIEENIAWPH